MASYSIANLIAKWGNRLRHNTLRSLRLHKPLTGLRYITHAPRINRRPRPDTILSLTSYPARFPTLHLTLMNLVSQRYRSDLIRLNLDPDTAAGLSESCKKIIRRHAIEVHETTRDIGSYGKLIPTMLDYPQSTIITADDDTYYPKNWAFGLVNAQRRYPNCTIGYRAHQIHVDEDGNPLPYSQWGSHLREPACGADVVLTGVSGILYPPGSIATEALDIDKFMVIAPSADDLWFWRMTIMAGYTPRKIGPKVYNYGWDGQSSRSLADYNVGQGGNDRAMAEILKKYPINGLQKTSPSP